MAKTVGVSAVIGKEHYKTTIFFGDQTILADEPQENGGHSLGPDPSTLLASALASCTAITLRMYADKKEYPLEQINVAVTLTKNDVSGETHSLFERKIKLIGAISEEQKDRLLGIADKCPTHKTLSGKIEIRTSIE